MKQEDVCAGNIRCTSPSLERQEVMQRAQEFASCDSLSEPQMVMASTIQLFDLLRINFVHLFEHLCIENILEFECMSILF